MVATCARACAPVRVSAHMHTETLAARAVRTDGRVLASAAVAGSDAGTLRHWRHRWLLCKVRAAAYCLQVATGAPARGSAAARGSRRGRRWAPCSHPTCTATAPVSTDLLPRSPSPQTRRGNEQNAARRAMEQPCASGRVGVGTRQASVTGGAGGERGAHSISLHRPRMRTSTQVGKRL